MNCHPDGETKAARPITVAIGAGCLVLHKLSWLLLVIGEPGYIFKAWSPFYVFLCELFTVAGVAFMAYSVWKGEKWPRLMWLVIVLVNFPIYNPDPQLLAETPFLIFAQDIFAVVGLICLFLPPSGAWFNTLDRCWPRTQVLKKIRRKPLDADAAPLASLAVPVAIMARAGILYLLYKRYFNAPWYKPDMQVMVLYATAEGVIDLISAAFMLKRREWARRLYVFAVPLTLALTIFITYFWFSDILGGGFRARRLEGMLTMSALGYILCSVPLVVPGVANYFKRGVESRLDKYEMGAPAAGIVLLILIRVLF